MIREIHEGAPFCLTSLSFVHAKCKKDSRSARWRACARDKTEDDEE